MINPKLTVNNINIVHNVDNEEFRYCVYIYFKERSNPVIFYYSNLDDAINLSECIFISNGGATALGDLNYNLGE